MMRRLFLRHPGIQATVKAVAFFVLLLLFETGGRASTVQLMSGNRLLPHQYAPILTSGGFFVPLELATLFGGEVSYEEGERSEEHTSELQSRENIVCRLLLEK